MSAAHLAGKQINQVSIWMQSVLMTVNKNNEGDH